MLHRFSAGLLVSLCAVFALSALSGCKHLEERTPPAGTWIVFFSQHDWQLYGVAGALDTRVFIKSERIPSNFPYSEAMATGYGGVLLVGDINGHPAAYDMSCPVENKPNVRIAVDEAELDAYCPQCGSRYWIFSNYGKPKSGTASKLGYELKKYSIAAGPNGEYRVIRP